jgi:PAS domain S-box-containing protein
VNGRSVSSAGRWAWRWYLLAGGVGAAAYLWAPGVAKLGYTYNVLGLSSVVAIIVGVRWHRPESKLAWYLLALGQALFVAGDVLAYNYERIFGAEQPFPSIADALYLAVYPSLILGLLTLIRRRTAGADRPGLLDATIITLGAGLVSWVFLMAPYAHSPDLSLSGKLTAIAYPLMDVALLAVLVRMAVGTGLRVLSFGMLLMGAAALLVTDAIYGWINLHHVYQAGGPLDLGWLAFYFLWGAAALHPSMRALELPAARAEYHSDSRWRLVILAGAALLGPVVEVIQLSTGSDLEAGVVSTCTAAMFVLVLLRLDTAVVDVGRYRRAERQARDAERKYRSLVEGLPSIVYVADVNAGGRWHYVSPQVADILGYAPDAFSADTTLWERSLHPEDHDDAVRQRTSGPGGRLRSQYRIRASDGRWVWIRDEAEVISDEVDARLLIQGVMYDVSDIKRAEDALVRALEAERDAAAHLRALDEMKNSFLQAVSHDIRTPLTSILGSAITLERPDLHLPAEDARDLAVRIAANARRLDRLLTNLLDLDRISRGIVEPNRRWVDLQEVTSAALEGMPLEGRPFSLEVAPVRADVDAAQVERIIENLVANALRYTPAGSPIEVRIGPSDDGVLISVDDRGPGVPEDIRSQIFEPFRQGSATEAHSPGVGIGLSLVARFATLHGGRSWVESRPAGGASFRVWLKARTKVLEERAPVSLGRPRSRGA